jgi:hypothetical protein
MDLMSKHFIRNLIVLTATVVCTTLYTAAAPAV